MTNTGDVRTDGWGNLLTGLGIASRDKRMSAEIQPTTRLTEQQLTNMFTGDALVRRICQLPAREQTRQWITVTTDTDAEVGKQVLQALQVLKAQSAVMEALTWARLYGAGLIWVGADDGRDPEEPLNENGIRTLQWLTVFDRYDLRPVVYSEDTDGGDYGEPEVYEIINYIPGVTATTANRRIHASRIIRFDGVLTPRRRRINNEWWCDSIFDALQGPVRDFWTGFDGAAHLTTDIGQGVFKIKNLASAMSGGHESLVLARLQLMDMTRSLVRAALVDADDEDYQRHPTPIAGVPDLLDRLAQLVSAVTEIPVTLLMGRSPAGENATGESDIRFFYDRIRSDQETTLRPALERLLTLMLRSKDGPTGGREPSDWSFAYNPLWQMTDQDKADVRRKQAETDRLYMDAQVVSPTEIRESRFGGDEYSVDTTIDRELDALLDQAGDDIDDEPPPGDEQADIDAEPQVDADS